MEKRPSLFLGADWASCPTHSASLPMGLGKESRHTCDWPITGASQPEGPCGLVLPCLPSLPRANCLLCSLHGPDGAAEVPRPPLVTGQGPSGQKTCPRWPHRPKRDPTFRPHTTWPPGRRAPRGALGGAGRGGAGRAPSGESGPARPRRQLQRRRHGEARGAAGECRVTAGGRALRSGAGRRVGAGPALVAAAEGGNGPCGPSARLSLRSRGPQRAPRQPSQL